MQSSSVILGLTSWCLVYFAIGIYLIIFYLLFKIRRELHDVSLLLTCHTCLFAFFLCLTMFIMICSNLFSGFLVFNLTFCYIWGLLYDVCECSIYFSYCLQAIYRLCRIIFYKKRYLVSYRLYVLFIFGQFCLVLALLLPPVFVDWYIHIPTETYCLIPYIYLGPETYHILVLYSVPLICLAVIYIWITTYMRATGRATTIALGVNQRLRNQRDLTVTKRILVLISILIVLRFPTIIFMVNAAIVGSVYPLAYAIVGLITGVCLILIGIITINITTQLKKQMLNIVYRRNHRVQNQGAQINQVNTPAAAMTE